MQTSASGSLIERMKGAARLEAATYEEVERDTSATIQAAIVIVLVSIATGIGALGDGGAGLIGGIVASLIAWLVLAAVSYVIGTKFLAEPGTEADLGQVLRTVGFARTPHLLNIVAFIPILGGIVALVAWIWGAFALVIALKQALELNISKAIATAVIASIVSGIFLWIIYLIFDISLPGS
jgi:hypothetical protein